MSNRATIELLDRLEAALGGITDYRAAKELGVTPSAVYTWRAGRYHMSAETVLAACELAGLGPAAFYWNNKVSAERDTGRVQQAAIAVVEDLEAMKRGKKPRPDGLVALLTRKSKYVAAALLSLSLATPPPAQAAAMQAFNRSIHYANPKIRCGGRRRRPRRRDRGGTRYPAIPRRRPLRDVIRARA